VAVGGTVSYSRVGVGVINTQHQAHLAIGTKVLDRMDDGQPPHKALEEVLDDDAEADIHQFLLIDVKGRKGAWTGSDCTPARRHRFGMNCVAAGNYLATEDVVEVMVDIFEQSKEGNLELRLLHALLAGADAGGDKRGHKAAAISVLPGPNVDEAINLDLRVDDRDDPFSEIVRLHRQFRREFPT
jgi:uncharacterized Ntn-hydrolase superfamily protein